MPERKEHDKRNPDAPPDANPDPITGTPGAHPVGTGVGAAGGGVAGAAIGAPAGPAGIVAGAAIGAVAGGLAGKGVAEAVNPTAEDQYWRENYASRPYVEPGREYDDYRPAYQYGWESRTRYAGRSFDEVEADLQRDWERENRRPMEWNMARGPARDAWDRIDRSQPKPSDPDAAPPDAP